MCIRRQSGYCCAQFQVCQNVPNAFTLDTIANNMGLQDTYCTYDYISIPGKAALVKSRFDLAA